MVFCSQINYQVLSTQSFYLMFVTFWIMTTVVSPILARTYKPTKQLTKYKRRTISSLEDDSEFRILVCIHNPRNVNSFVNLLEASNPTRQSPICATAVHLVENTGRAAAMLIVHDACKSEEDENKDLPHLQNMNSFENLESRNEGITVQQLTAVSSYSTIHEDICSLAEGKQVSLIVVPFHKQCTTVEAGTAENSAHDPFRDANKHVMDHAQCSVAIFVDRGLGSAHNHVESNHGRSDRRHFCMLFIGGPDDREALAYSWRVARNPRNILTVIRLVASQEHHAANDHQQPRSAQEGGGGNEGSTTDGEKAVDNEYITEFKLKARSNPTVEFMERVVDNLEEVVQLMEDLERECDVFIVGRGTDTSSSLTAGLSGWCEFPELGPLGDILVSSSFTNETSVLIIKQGTTSSKEEQLGGRQLKVHVGRMTLQVPEAQPKTEFAAFVHRRGGSHDGDHI